MSEPKIVINKMLTRQALACWVSEPTNTLAHQLKEAGSRNWLKARLRAVVMHDRALATFDAGVEPATEPKP